MSERDIADVLNRIDRALGRIEAADRRAPAAVATGDPALEQRHQRLRRATSAAIHEIDTLLGRGD